MISSYSEAPRISGVAWINGGVFPLIVATLLVLSFGIFSYFKSFLVGIVTRIIEPSQQIPAFTAS